MKEKLTPHIIAVSALVVFIVLGLACASQPKLPAATNDLVIPRGTYSIYYNSYAGKGIETVVFPDSLENIDSNVFMNNNITAIRFPSTLKFLNIGSSAFKNNQLSSVSFPTIKSSRGLIIGSSAFADNQITTLSFSDNTSITIGSNAFANNPITRIVFPKNVKIDTYAFSNLQLDNLIIPHGIQNIPEGTYKNNRLSILTIPDGIIKIMESAFENNILTELELPEGLETIETMAFAGNNLTTVRIPQSVKLIEEGAFDLGVVLTGKVINFTPVIKTVPFYHDDSIVQFRVLNSRGNSVNLAALRRPNSIPVGVHTIIATTKGRTMNVRDPSSASGAMLTYQIPQAFNLSITYDFEEGYSYRLGSTVDSSVPEGSRISSAVGIHNRNFVTSLTISKNNTTR